MEAHLLADRQAQLTAALSVGAEDFDPLDVADAIEQWTKALDADPTGGDTPAVQARLAQLLEGVV